MRPRKIESAARSVSRYDGTRIPLEAFELLIPGKAKAKKRKKCKKKANLLPV